MPIRESVCSNCGVELEWWGKAADPEPICDNCGTQMEWLPSRFGVIWTGDITGKYLDRAREHTRADGSHWVWRTKGTKSGKPEPVRIETFQQQREFCKAEGLGLPQDAAPVTISADGKSTKPMSETESREYVDHHNRQAAKTAQEAAA